MVWTPHVSHSTSRGFSEMFHVSLMAHVRVWNICQVFSTCQECFEKFDEKTKKVFKLQDEKFKRLSEENENYLKEILDIFKRDIEDLEKKYEETEFSNLDCKVDKIGNDLSELKGEFRNLNYQNRRPYTYSENSPNIINRSDTHRSRTDDERATLSTVCLHPWNLLNFCQISLKFFFGKIYLKST